MSLEKLRILIVDDNLSIHGDFTRILATQSANADELNQLSQQLFKKKIKPTIDFPEFLIDAVFQGNEGIQKVDEAIKQGKPYALAYVDIRMPPGLNGIETIKRIFKIDPNIQVIICTAYTDYSWDEIIENLGQRDNLFIIQKPFDPLVIRQLSYALTKKWQLLQESKNVIQSGKKNDEEHTQSLQRSLTIVRSIIESAEDAILVINNAKVIIEYNQKILSLWKISKKLFDADSARILLKYIANQLEEPERFLTFVDDMCKQHEIIELNKLKCRDGRMIAMHTRPYKIKDIIAGQLLSFRDVTKKALADEKMQFQATHDPLTGLSNRILLMDYMHQEIAKATRNKSIFAVIFLNIDKFKLINERFNHLVGDEILRSIAKSLKTTMREVDIFSRLGSDEFVGMISSLTDKKNILKIADKVLNIFKKPFNIENQEITVTCSIGVSIFPADGKDANELLQSANIAMYKAKKLNNNQIQFYSDEFQNKQN